MSVDWWQCLSGYSARDVLSRPGARFHQWTCPVSVVASCPHIVWQLWFNHSSCRQLHMVMFAKLMRSYGECGNQQRKKSANSGSECLNQNEDIKWVQLYIDSKWLEVCQRDQLCSPRFSLVTCPPLANLAHARFWERPSKLCRRNRPWRFGLKADESIWDRQLMSFDNQTLLILIISNIHKIDDIQMIYW